MHSSQGSRYPPLRKFPRPVPEPATARGQGHGGRGAGTERGFDTPVLIRTTTRIAHSHSAVAVGPDRPAPRGERPAYRVDPRKYVMVPANARARRPLMEERMSAWPNMPTTMRSTASSGATGTWASSPPARPTIRREVFPRRLFSSGHDLSAPAAAWRICRRRRAPHRVEKLDPFIEEEIKFQGLACEGKSIFPLIASWIRASFARALCAPGCCPRAGAAPGPGPARSAAASAGALPGLPPPRGVCARAR